MFLLCSSCKDKMDNSLSDFENALEVMLDRKLIDFSSYNFINESRYKTNYDYFKSYYEISENIKINIKSYQELTKGDRLSLISQDVDSLFDKTINIYKTITYSLDSSGAWFRTEKRYLDRIFTPIKKRISTCESIRDMQDFKIMLYHLDLYVQDFLLNQSKSGLFTFSEIKGPIMVTKGDSVFFHLTAYDSTIADFIIIGDFDIKQGETGNYYITNRFDEEIYFSDFSIGLPKDRVIDKEFLYVTVGPAGDTIRRPIQR